MPNPFHAGHKLAWLEQVASDPATSDFELRVAVSVSRRADRTGVATADQASLANFIDATSRGVRNGLKELVALNHLKFEGPRSGGRGIVGRYRLILKSELDRPSGASGNGKTRNAAACTDDSRNGIPGKSEQDRRKHGTSLPPLPYSSIESLGAESHSSASDFPVEWQTIVHRATERYGSAIMSSWFAKLKVDGVEEGVGTILAPTRFIADYVSTQYGDHILHWWKLERPSLRRLRFIVRA